MLKDIHCLAFAQRFQTRQEVRTTRMHSLNAFFKNSSRHFVEALNIFKCASSCVSKYLATRVLSFSSAIRVNIASKRGRIT